MPIDRTDLLDILLQVEEVDPSEWDIEFAEGGDLWEAVYEGYGDLIGWKINALGYGYLVSFELGVYRQECEAEDLGDIPALSQAMRAACIIFNKRMADPGTR